MFKKSLVAASIAVLSMNASAVDITTSSTAATYGSEALNSGLVANTGNLFLGGNTAATGTGQVKLELNAEYSVGDIIKVTLAGGKFGAKGAYTLTDTAAAANKSQLVFGLLNSTTTELTFRVTSITAATSGTDSTLDSVLTLAGAAGTGVADSVILDATAVGSVVTISAAAETSTGIAIDSAGTKDSFKVGSVIAQHKLTVSPVMAGVIDVAKARKEFETAADAKFIATYAATTPLQASMPGTANVITVTGDHSAFPGTAATGQLSDGAVVGTVATDKQSSTLTYAAAPATKTLTFAVATDATKRAVLSSGDYTVSMKITESAKTATLSAVKAGAFKLNGASVDVPYVPYGSSVEQFIWVTNKGSLDGEITVTAFDENGKTYGPYDIGTAKKGTLTKLDAAIKAKLVADGVASERVSLNVTVNVKKDDLEVFAAYKVIGADDRLSLKTVKLN
jgi:hypothetical protein